MQAFCGIVACLPCNALVKVKHARQSYLGVCSLEL